MNEFFGFPNLFYPKLKPVTILHQQTCPDCGRTLVNIYRRGDEWKCNGCWDRIDHGNILIHKTEA